MTTTPPPPTSPEKKTPGWVQIVEAATTLMKESVAHVIAMGIVAASLLLLTAELLGSGDRKIETAQGIAAIVGPWVGVIIGFYFGARSGEKQAEAAEAKAATASAGVDVAEEEQEAALAEAQTKVRELQDRLERLLGGAP